MLNFVRDVACLRFRGLRIVWVSFCMSGDLGSFRLLFCELFGSVDADCLRTSLQLMSFKLPIRA